MARAFQSFILPLGNMALNIPFRTIRDEREPLPSIKEKRSPFTISPREIREPLVPFRKPEIAAPSMKVEEERLVPSIKIKIPFVPTGFKAPSGMIPEVVKWAVELPEKAVKSLSQVPYIIKTGGKLPKRKEKYWDISTYQEDAKEIFDAVIDGRAPLIYGALPFIEVPIDFTLLFWKCSGEHLLTSLTRIPVPYANKKLILAILSSIILFLL